MTKTSELAHLFRSLKAPAAARATPALAERAREEQWGYERFLEAVLSAEVGSRESHGGEGGSSGRGFRPERRSRSSTSPSSARSESRSSSTWASSTSATRATTS
jgi:hypothetical protein